MGKVVYFRGLTRRPIPPDQILDLATETRWNTLLLVGYDSNGDLDIRSSVSDGAELLWMIEKVRQRLLEMSDEFEGGDDD